MKKSSTISFALLLCAGLLVTLSQGSLVGTYQLPLIVGLLLGGTWFLQKDNKLNWLAIGAVAVLLRLLFLPFPESDDIYRYLWEGLIQHEGFNPFVFAPDAPELAHIKFTYHDTINHPDFATIYWPVAQLLFRFVTLFSTSPLIMKLVLCLFDLGIILLLWKLLPDSKKSLSLWYIFNPVVLFATAGEGHLEIIPIFFVVLALFFYRKKQHGWMYLALGLSIFTKVNYLLFLPLFVRGDNWKRLPMALLPLLLFIPYFSAETNPLLVPFRFGGEFAWNGPLFTLFSLALPQKLIYLCIGVVLLSGYAVTYLTAVSKEDLLLKGALLFILCTPTLHYWYLLMVTPLLVLRPKPAWILLHGTIFCTGFYFHPEIKGVWTNLPLMQLCVFLPPLTMLIWQFKSFIHRNSVQPSNGYTLSIVMPILNEADSLHEKIRYLQHAVPQAELIFVDGGSTDSSREIIQSEGLTALSSEKGRGIQIATGAEAASRSVVVILHADTTPTAEALHRVEQTMRNYPAIIGGSCGLRYDTQQGYFPLIEFLNAVKVLLFGISFGDQMQFLRREFVSDAIPHYLLMEDMELSMRLNELGQVAYLPGAVTVSSRRWTKHGFRKNVTTVLKLVVLFLLRRQLGTIDEGCRSFYESYYGKEKSPSTR